MLPNWILFMVPQVENYTSYFMCSVLVKKLKVYEHCIKEHEFRDI